MLLSNLRRILNSNIMFHFMLCENKNVADPRTVGSVYLVALLIMVFSFSCGHGTGK